MKEAIYELSESYNVPYIVKKISEIALDISKTRLDAAGSIGKQNKIIQEEYEKAINQIGKGNYDLGFDSLEEVFLKSTMLINGETLTNPDIIKTKNDEEIDIFLTFLIFILIISITIFFVKLKTDFK